MPYNPGNVRRLNALGGKRPQATGIAILPKNGDRVLNTSEGSVNNYGGNKKMGLYSNVGMSYKFQNMNLTGQRLNGNMPYFWGTKHANTKPSKKQKNMLTVTMLDDGDKGNDQGTKGFVSYPYWGPISKELADNGFLHESYVNTSMGNVNTRAALAVSNTKVIAIEMWRSGYGGPVDYSVAPGIHIWTESPLNFSSVVIKQAGVECRLGVTAVYSKATPPIDSASGAGGAALAKAGNFNDAVSSALSQTNVTFPDVATIADAKKVPDNDTVRVYWLKFPAAVVNGKPNINGVNARKIFPRKSSEDATQQNKNISRALAIYFE